jgi:hypothetical protein
MSFVTAEPEMPAVAAGALRDVGSAMYAEKEPVRAKILSRILIRTIRQAPVLSAGALPGDADVSTPPSAPLLRRAHPRRIVRREYLQSSSLDPAQRCAMIDRLYGVYCETVCGDSRDEFEGLVFGAGEVRFALFYGTQGELAGFSYAAIERIANAGRRHAVFLGGVFFRLGYHSGALAVLFAIRQALRLRLRHPRVRMAYLTRSTTPAVYRLLATTFPRHYPDCRRQTPDEVEALVRELSVRRRYVPIGGNPWVVTEDTSLRVPSRLGRLEDNPLARFYIQLNPRFAEGESLLTWIPLDAANIAAGIFLSLRALLAR